MCVHMTYCTCTHVHDVEGIVLLFSSSFFLLEYPRIVVGILFSTVATPLLPDLILPLASILTPLALCGQ